MLPNQLNMQLIIEKLEELPFPSYFSNAITTQQEWEINVFLFDLATIFLKYPEKYTHEYAVIYDILQTHVAEHTSAFILLLNLINSEINMDKSTFRILRAMEYVHHKAAEYNAKGIRRTSFYVTMFFFIARLFALNNKSLLSKEKLHTLDIDLDKCPQHRYFDLVLEAAPLMTDNAPFLKNCAVHIVSTMHYYCALELFVAAE